MQETPDTWRYSMKRITVTAVPSKATSRQAWGVEDLIRDYPMSKTWWWNMIRGGQLRTVRLGRRRIVMQHDLEAFLRSKGAYGEPPTAA
jgi:hypothetical protein